MKHTPTPWTTRTEDGSIGSIDAADGTMVAQALQVRPRREDPYHEERKANAEFIVTACNAHDHLVAALREIVKNDPHNQHNSSIFARRALTAAGVE